MAPQLYRLAALAEHYFPSDANTCLFKLRQFAELLAQYPHALFCPPRLRNPLLIFSAKHRASI